MPSLPSMPPSASGLPPDGASRFSAPRRWAAYLKHMQVDWLLLDAVAVCALLLGFQLLLILLQSPWVGPVTDWLRAALAWPELLIVAAVSLRLCRRRRLDALTWWLFGAGILCLAIGRTWWSIDDTLIYLRGVPFPAMPDLFFVLQYPFLFLAVILIPFTGFWGSRAVAGLDAVLWIGAATALSWYFLLAPLFAASGLAPLARWVSLGYPVADLFLLVALVLILLRPLRYPEDRPAVGIIIASVVCLVMADMGATYLILHPAHEYRTGQFPDFFWLASDLLIPLAAIVQFRVVQRTQSGPEAGSVPEWLQGLHGLDREDLRTALRLFVPLVAALLASMAILFRAGMAATAGPASIEWRRLAPPLAVGSCLLFLVIVRQVIVFLETARLRHTVVAAQAQEQALRELHRRKDEFLNVVSHELRTPLTSLELFFFLLERRLDTLFDRLPPRGPGGPGGPGVTGHPSDRDDEWERERAAEALQTTLVYSQASVRRLARLADDLVDDARIRQGRLSLRLEPCDLSRIVRVAVEEQRAAAFDRTILLELPGGDSGQPVLVLADADRIAQVVTNYLTNALKYSKEDQPVAVQLEVVKAAKDSEESYGGEGDVVCVSVHDDGIGVPFAAQPHVWERFYIVEGNTVQSGSGISLGLGLHIGATIIAEHHGQVGLESAPGQGSTFWLTLPLAPPVQLAIPAASSVSSLGAV